MDTGLVSADPVAVGFAPDRDQHQVITLRLGRCLFTVKGHPDALLAGLSAHRAGIDHHPIKTQVVVLLPDLDQVAIRPLHQAIQPFDHVDTCTKGRIDGGHFQADNPAAHHQHALGHRLEFKGAGGIHDAWIIRHERQRHRLATGSNHALLEPDHLLFTRQLKTCARTQRDLKVMRVQKTPDPAYNLNLSPLGHPRQPAGQCVDHRLFMSAQRTQINLTNTKLNAHGGQVRHFLHHRSDMQQRFGGDAADIQAHAAQGGVALNQQGFLAQIGRAKGRRIAAGATTQHQHIALNTHIVHLTHVRPPHRVIRRKSANSAARC